MKTLIEKFWGQTRYWWVVLVAGILMVICGFAYWFWPVAGYAVASQIFGWLLILVGIVQLLVASGPDRGKGWGWWLAGGVIDIFIGFMLVRSIVLSQSGRRYWWLYLINGILLMLIGFFFIEAGWVQDMAMTSFLTSLAFIYWGFSLAMLSYDMKPVYRR